MAMYRKRPVVVEAFRWGFDMVPDWFRQEIGSSVRISLDLVIIDTLEGSMRAKVGDWIIRGVKDEIYPCQHDIFVATHEPAEVLDPAS